MDRIMQGEYHVEAKHSKWQKPISLTPPPPAKLGADYISKNTTKVLKLSDSLRSGSGTRSARTAATPPPLSTPPLLKSRQSALPDDPQHTLKTKLPSNLTPHERQWARREKTPVKDREREKLETEAQPSFALTRSNSAGSKRSLRDLRAPFESWESSAKSGMILRHKDGGGLKKRLQESISARYGRLADQFRYLDSAKLGEGGGGGMVLLHESIDISSFNIFLFNRLYIFVIGSVREISFKKI
jgi:hypothetical protein